MSDIGRDAPKPIDAGESRLVGARAAISAGGHAHASQWRETRRIEGWLAFGAYLLLAAAYLGRLALRDPAGGTLGTGPDVQIFVWGLRWWPYAIGHGLDPLFTRLVWPPGGIAVLWSTTVPALSLLMAPVTLTLGPVAAWNLLCVLAPAAAGWGAWLLCRELGAGRWPSLLGGALFGFCSFEVAQGLAHLQMTMSVLVPLAAYTVVRHVSGRLGSRGLVGRLATITILQFLISPELLVTTLIVATVAAAAAVMLMPDLRTVVLRTTRLAALGVAAGCVPLAPLLASMLTHRPAQLSASVGYPADLLNLVIPTPVTAAGGAWATGITASYPGNLAEQCAYIGVPMLAILAAFAIAQRARPSARVLIVILVTSVLCSLGSRLTVDGHATIWLPWAILSRVPVVGDALPVRFALFTALVSAIITAQWLSHPHRVPTARWVLAILAAVSIVPATAAARWQPIPTAITSPALDRALAHQRVLSLPFFKMADRGLYAQASDDMRFAVIDNWMQLPPREFNRFTELQGPQLTASSLRRLRGQRARVFEQQLCEAHITRLLVWEHNPRFLAGLRLDPARIGGALVYDLPRCPGR